MAVATKFRLAKTGVSRTEEGFIKRHNPPVGKLAPSRPRLLPPQWLFLTALSKRDACSW
jgi:hypothetical protein